MCKLDYIFNYEFFYYHVLTFQQCDDDAVIKVASKCFMYSYIELLI